MGDSWTLNVSSVFAIEWVSVLTRNLLLTAWGLLALGLDTELFLLSPCPSGTPTARVARLLDFRFQH